MLKYIQITLIIMLIGINCSRYESVQTNSSADLDRLFEKSERYQSQITNHLDENGFIYTDKCDSLLFTSLLGAATKSNTLNIEAAYVRSIKQWHRRPSKDCGPEWGNSHSTISRDMILGLMVYMWKSKRLDLAVELMDQLKSNLYKLEGEGSLGELQMLPSYLNTLALLIEALGGESYYLELNLPAMFKATGEGYVKHLTAWHIYLRGEIRGEISEHEMGVLETLREDNPLNPLFDALHHKYTDGNYDRTYKILMSESIWPEAHLPTTSNYCDEWVIQRDNERDWEPCPGREVTVTGAELIVIVELVLR